GPVPATVVLHEWKVRHAERAVRLCRTLARAGIAAVLVPLPYHLDRTPPGVESGKLMVTPDPDRTVAAVVQAVVDVRCMVDWLTSRPEIDGQRIGLVGISLGAMVGLIATQVEPRLHAAVSILGAACPIRIFKDSPLVRLLLWRRLRQAGLTEEELREKFRVVDATEFAGNNDDLKLLMISARHDVIVPKSAVMVTWEKLGRPQLLWLDSGHWSAAICSGRLTGAAVDYLKVAFGLAPGPYKLPSVPSSAVDIGLLCGSRSGLMGAIVFEPISLGGAGKASVDVGLTTRGPFVGLSVRPFEYGKIGYGIRPLSDHARGEVFWMLQVTF
ncbi:MAG: alpha/beta hydrolase family protein, partial [Armatimonadetes bacterium]|nr:alpha/beta hydrolase family protein [Armatimonadota bacterium]